MAASCPGVCSVVTAPEPERGNSLPSDARYRAVESSRQMNVRRICRGLPESEKPRWNRAICTLDAPARVKGAFDL